MASAAGNSFQDSAADVLAVVILVLVPIIVIAVFWLVHILPEKIAEKRHHPQKEAIKVLCLLSLVFGGMLWPFAWLWAYSKPVLHKLAYGRDKHEDFYLEGEPQERPEVSNAEASDADEAAHLRAEIDSLRLEMRALAGENTPEAQRLRQRLDSVEHAVERRDLKGARH